MGMSRLVALNEAVQSRLKIYTSDYMAILCSEIYVEPCSWCPDPDVGEHALLSSLFWRAVQFASSFQYKNIVGAVQVYLLWKK
jgi:hypothetical protein